MELPFFKQHSCVFVRKVGDSYAKIKTIKVREHVDSISFKGKSYVLDFSKPVWRDGKKGIYVVDLDSGQLKFSASEKTFPELTDQIFERKIVSQLVSSLQMPGFTTQILMIILGIIIGAVMGYFMGSTFPAQQVFKR